MPDLDPLHLGPIAGAQLQLTAGTSPAPGWRVKEPVVPAPPSAFVLVDPVTGRAPDWLDDSDCSLLRQPMVGSLPVW